MTDRSKTPEKLCNFLRKLARVLPSHLFLTWHHMSSSKHDALNRLPFPFAHQAARPARPVHAGNSAAIITERKTGTTAAAVPCENLEHWNLIQLSTPEKALLPPIEPHQGRPRSSAHPGLYCVRQRRYVTALHGHQPRTNVSWALLP